MVKMLVRVLRTPVRILTRSISSTNAEVDQNLLNELSKTASLYIHWPYCNNICHYCNFNKYKSKNVDSKRMERSLRQELKQQLNHYEIDSINSIFFGGGTPSLCDVVTVENLINDVYRICDVKGDAEISLEANPSSESLSKLRSFKAAGINRVSIGVQALNDNDLVKLGRDHTVQDAVEYVEEANHVFGDHTSIDLMFARPGQTLQSWQSELKLALELSTSHISLYQLTMERSTPMEKMHRRGEIVLPEGDAIADMYHHSVQFFENSGLKRYEVANFAVEGLECKHNMAYWRGRQYIGLGPGAHGRVHRVEDGELQRYATVQTLSPEKWMTKVEQEADGMRKVQKLGRLETLEELLLQGLRSKCGVNDKVFSAFSGGLHLDDLLAARSVKDLMNNGFIVVNSSGLRATDTGMGVLESLVPDICLALENLFKQHTVN